MAVTCDRYGRGRRINGSGPEAVGITLSALNLAHRIYGTHTKPGCTRISYSADHKGHNKEGGTGRENVTPIQLDLGLGCSSVHREIPPIEMGNLHLEMEIIELRRLWLAIVLIS